MTRRALGLIPLVLVVACAPKQRPTAAAEDPNAVNAAGGAQTEGEVAAEADAPVVLGEDMDGNGEMWQVVKADEFTMAVPDNWIELQAPEEHIKMLRVGDGIGIPPVDEMGEPLQAGFVIEVREGPYDDPSKLADTLLEELKADTTATLLGEPMRGRVQMCDGSAGEFVAVGFIRPEENRKSLFTQVFSTDDAGQGWVTSGYLISGPQSQVTEADSLAAGWMASHALSFCNDPNEFEEEGVAAAYQALELAMQESHAAIEAEKAAIEAGEGPTKTGTETEQLGPPADEPVKTGNEVGPADEDDANEVEPAPDGQ